MLKNQSIRYLRLVESKMLVRFSKYLGVRTITTSLAFNSTPTSSNRTVVKLIQLNCRFGENSHRLNQRLWIMIQYFTRLRCSLPPPPFSLPPSLSPLLPPLSSSLPPSLPPFSSSLSSLPPSPFHLHLATSWIILLTFSDCKSCRCPSVQHYHRISV